MTEHWPAEGIALTTASTPSDGTTLLRFTAVLSAISILSR